VLFRHREVRELGAITERIRAVILRQSGHTLRIAADTLQLPALDLARLLDAPEVADRAFVIDVITALAYEAGVDPQWLLTGEYDGAVHRHVLTLGDGPGAKGRAAVREFVEQQYGRLRRDAMFAWWPLSKLARQHRAHARAKSA